MEHVKSEIWDLCINYPRYVIHCNSPYNTTDCLFTVRVACKIWYMYILTILHAFLNKRFYSVE